MSICVENVSCIYGKGSPFEKTALENINLTIDSGEFVGIIGHTGSGKSTLIQHLNGLIHPASGRVTVDGVDLAGKTKEAVRKRHSVGMVFQYPEHQLFEETVAKDIAFGQMTEQFIHDYQSFILDEKGLAIGTCRHYLAIVKKVCRKSDKESEASKLLPDLEVKPLMIPVSSFTANCVSCSSVRLLPATLRKSVRPQSASEHLTHRG